jgi:putative aldouronate transport system permease protein
MAVHLKTQRIKRVDLIIYIVITLYTLSIFYPFYYIVINSLNAKLSFGKVFFWPDGFTLSNYTIVLKDDTLLKAITVSVLRTFIGTVLSVFICALCGYALRKSRLLLRNFYLILFTIPMFFSGGLIPTFLNLKMLGLYNEFLVYVLPGAFNFFFVIILMSCFNDIPDALEESAHMDGANHLKVFFAIYLPLSVPVLATLSLFAGVIQWNSWFDTLYFTKANGLMTIAGIMTKIINQSNFSSLQMDLFAKLDAANLTTEGIKLATMIISIIPVLLIYPIMQKYFVSGIRIGAIKG